MTLVDGKKIAQEISVLVAERVEGMETKPTLTVIACNPNFETQKYLALKKTKAETLGISLSVLILPSEADTQTVVNAILESAKNTNGIIVQLPLPLHIDTDLVLASIPPSHDVDAFSYQAGKSKVLPPVVGAIDEISKKHHIDWSSKKVVIFGQGRLVGAPMLEYAKRQDSQISVVLETTKNVEQFTKNADIIVLGVGKQNLLTPAMVKDGVVVFDAGASEDGGILVGDASPEVNSKSALFTPVPGGIGPITVALLFHNLLELQSRQ